MRWFQTRSEENGLKYFDTLDEALATAREDGSIWKISFDAASGKRIRLVRSSVPEAEFPVFILVQLKDEVAKEIERLTGVDDEIKSMTASQMVEEFNKKQGL